MKTLPFIEVYKNLYLSPCSFERSVIKSISLLNFYDGSSRMFTCVNHGQLARELLRYWLISDFPLFPASEFW